MWFSFHLNLGLHTYVYIYNSILLWTPIKLAYFPLFAQLNVFSFQKEFFQI